VIERYDIGKVRAAREDPRDGEKEPGKSRCWRVDEKAKESGKGGKNPGTKSVLGGDKQCAFVCGGERGEWFRRADR